MSRYGGSVSESRWERLQPRRVGPVPKAQQARITGLKIGELVTLGETLLDFTEAVDLTAWLAAY